MSRHAHHSPARSSPPQPRPGARSHGPSSSWKSKPDQGLTGLGSVGGLSLLGPRRSSPASSPRCWKALTRRTSRSTGHVSTTSLNRQGQRGTGVMALSGVDLALWDLLGKSVDRPVVSLIGGRVHPPGCRSTSVRFRCVGRQDRQVLLDEVADGRRHGFQRVQVLHRARDDCTGKRGVRSNSRLPYARSGRSSGLTPT